MDTVRLHPTMLAMERTTASAGWLSGAVLLAFGAYSAWVIASDPFGLLPVARTLWGSQVSADLYIALAIGWAFIAKDARAGVRLWPWMLASVLVGSLSPLAYLTLQGLRASSRATGHRQPQTS